MPEIVTPQNLIQRTVALTNAAQSIFTLLDAIFTNVPVNCCSIEVEADPTLTTTDVYCGDALVSSTNHAFVLVAGSENIWRIEDKEGLNSLGLSQFYLRAASSTPSVNIIVRRK